MMTPRFLVCAHSFMKVPSFEIQGPGREQICDGCLGEA